MACRYESVVASYFACPSRQACTRRFIELAEVQVVHHPPDRERCCLRHLEREQVTAREQAQPKRAPRITETDSPQQIGVASADEAAGNSKPLETAGDIVRNGAVDLIFDAGVEP